MKWIMSRGEDTEDGNWDWSLYMNAWNMYDVITMGPGPVCENHVYVHKLHHFKIISPSV